jgi:hypothetical protein
MSEQAGAVRTNISLPADLKARMDEVDQRVNWSGVAAEAFQRKLLELESRKEGETMDEARASYKARGELEENEEYQAGYEAGETWAKNQGTPKQLRRLEGYVDEFARQGAEWWDVESPGWAAPGGATGSFAIDVLGLNRDNAERDDIEGFWEQALDNAKRIEDADFFHGFGDGAIAMREKLENEP